MTIWGFMAVFAVLAVVLAISKYALAVVGLYLAYKIIQTRVNRQ